MDIYIPYIWVSTHGHDQNIGQNLPKPFLPISRIWNISTGNIFIKIQEKFSKSQMHIVITLQSLISIKVILVHQKCPKIPSDRNQIWTSLYYQLSLLDPNFCGHVHMTKWGHYTKWCIKENRFAWLNLEKSISANF